MAQWLCDCCFRNINRVDIICTCRTFDRFDSLLLLDLPMDTRASRDHYPGGCSMCMWPIPSLLFLAGLASSLPATSVSDVSGTRRFSATTVDVLTAALTAFPADMPLAQVTAVSDALRTRLDQMRRTVAPTLTSMSMPDFHAQSVAVTITPLDATTFAVASVDTGTGQPRSTGLFWVDATHIDATALTGSVQSATEMADAAALERVTPEISR